VAENGIKIWGFVDTIMNIQFIEICGYLEQTLAVMPWLIDLTELHKYNTAVTAVIITIVRLL
jgi:hypothetical protein